jgi:hypothetical protein
VDEPGRTAGHDQRGVRRDERQRREVQVVGMQVRDQDRVALTRLGGRRRAAAAAQVRDPS